MKKHPNWQTSERAGIFFFQEYFASLWQKANLFPFKICSGVILASEMSHFEYEFMLRKRQKKKKMVKKKEEEEKEEKEREKESY